MMNKIIFNYNQGFSSAKHWNEHKELRENIVKYAKLLQRTW